MATANLASLPAKERSAGMTGAGAFVVPAKGQRSAVRESAANASRLAKRKNVVLTNVGVPAGFAVTNRCARSMAPVESRDARAEMRPDARGAVAKTVFVSKIHFAAVYCGMGCAFSNASPMPVGVAPTAIMTPPTIRMAK